MNMVINNQTTTDKNTIKLEVLPADNSSTNKKKSKVRKMMVTEKEKVNRFQDSVRLCCVSISTGPGTGFSSFDIPQGTKCFGCGSTINKTRE